MKRILPGNGRHQVHYGAHLRWNSRSGIEVYGFPQLNDCA